MNNHLAIRTYSGLKMLFHNKMLVLPYLILLSILMPMISSHSWITCTDYMEENGEYWNSDLCRSFPRHGHIYTPRSGTFGLDKGYDYNRPSDNKPCRTPRNDNEAYNSDHQMAVYYPGQKVVITHPTKVRFAS